MLLTAMAPMCHVISTFGRILALCKESRPIKKTCIFHFKLNNSREISAPTKPPKDVQLVSNTWTSISVSWGEIPENARNADILGFDVLYCKQVGLNCSPRKVALVYSLDITGLDPGKAYKVQVRGYNTIGSGPWSSSQQVIVGGKIARSVNVVVHSKLSCKETFHFRLV